MDEKTEELRDIFIDATGSDTVTERQEESPGSLTDVDEDVEGRVRELVATMRDRYEFAAGLDGEAYATVVHGYFDGRSDADLAADLGAEEGTVFDARMDLHLVDEADRDAPFDLDELSSLHVDDVPLAKRAAELRAEPDVVRRFSEVVAADLESTRANDRFRTEFRELLTDADLEASHVREAREDGLREAAEDIETDVQF